MLRIAICDDESIMRKEIIRGLDEYSRLRNLDITYDQYETGAEFLRSKRSYQLVMLDYQLDKDTNHTGLSVAQKLRSVNKDIAIIFLTNYPKIVFSSFEVSAFRFLVKPLAVDKLFKALDAFMKTLETDAVLMIKHDGSTKILNTKNILYIEGDGKYCTIHMSDLSKPIDCHETLASVELRLPDDLFSRCHRSYVVNLKYVLRYDHQEITLQNDRRVYISRKKHEDFENAFFNYLKRYGY